MLPTINLQLGELATFDNASDNTSLIPEGSLEPKAEFSSILRSRVDSQGSVEQAGGDSLPAGGNDLPLQPLLVDEFQVEESMLKSLDTAAGPGSGAEPIHAGSGDSPGRPALAPLDVVATTLDLIAVEPQGLGQRFDADPGMSKGPRPAPMVPPELPADQSDTPPVIATPVLPGNIGQAALAVNADAVAAARDAMQNRTGSIGGDSRRGHLPGSTLLTGSIRPGLAPGQSVEPDVSLQAVVDRSGLANTGPAPLVSLDGPKSPVRPNDSVLQQALPIIDEAGRQAVQTEPLARLVTATGEAILQSAPTSNDIGALAAAGPRHAIEAPRSDLAQAVSQAIELPVQESGWDKAISQRVLLMANGKLQNADIRLSPAELGPLRVQVSIDDGAANVSFQAQHALTREAIEQALPRLREMLAENGLTLGQTNVSDQGVAERGHDDQAESASRSASSSDADTETHDAAPTRARVETGLVDTFA